MLMLMFRYVFENGKPDELFFPNILEWMEWEFACLRTLVTTMISSGKPLDKVQKLCRVLKDLDTLLTQKNCITEVCDVLVFGIFL